MHTTSTKDDTNGSKNTNLLKYIYSYIKYKFNHLFTYGVIFIIPLLIIISIIVVLIFSIIYYFTHIVNHYDDAVWQSFMRILNPCAAAEDEGLNHRVVSGILILCGLVIIAVLIGTIVTFMDEKLRELKKGHTTVIEKNHTSKIYKLNWLNIQTGKIVSFLCLVILGYSPKIVDIINELIIANESQRNPSIVILSSKERSEIQYMIKSKIHNTKNTRIIYRNGDPLSVRKKKHKKLFFLTNSLLFVSPFY
jgi:hypothetical protein